MQKGFFSQSNQNLCPAGHNLAFHMSSIFKFHAMFSKLILVLVYNTYALSAVLTVIRTIGEREGNMNEWKKHDNVQNKFDV